MAEIKLPISGCRAQSEPFPLQKRNSTLGSSVASRRLLLNVDAISPGDYDDLVALPSLDSRTEGLENFHQCTGLSN